MKINFTGIMINALVLLAGWCFGDKSGLGAAATILVLIHVIPRIFN